MSIAGAAAATLNSAAEAPGLRRAWLAAVLVWIAALVSGLGVLWLQIQSDRQENQRRAVEVASTQANMLHQRLDSALSSTYALAAVLRQNHYVVDPVAFEQFATELLKYHPGVSSLQYAPGGVLRNIVPLRGNEGAIGHDLLRSSDRNSEAMQAILTRQLTTAGPFDLKQGGVGLAGRLPIFQPRAGVDGEEFWGFATALIRIGDLMQAADIGKLEREGYDYELWRVHPDSGERKIFSRSGDRSLDDPVVFDFEVPNGRWYLSVEPRGGWAFGHRLVHVTGALVAVLFASLVATVVLMLMRQPVLLRRQVAERTRELASEIAVRREAEAQLRLAAKVFESSAEAVMITDADERIVSVNEAFERISGYSAAEALGKSPALLASGRHGTAFFAAMRDALLRDGRWQGEIWNRRKNGEVFPQWLGISLLRDEAGKITNFVSISSDITERKASEERINYLAHYDALTGLPNRVLLRDRVQQAMANADRGRSRVSLLSLDLDRFKVINDTLGHENGDLLLQQVVARLKETVRSSDTISRQGGDEFVIVAPDQGDASVATRLVQKIMERLAEPFVIDGTEVRVSSSIGISVYPDDGADFETLVKKCDIAMYHAKESGRATYRYFTAALNDDASERLTIEADLARAIERGEFRLHYQPQIDLAGGHIVGAEALIRWVHPEKGMVPPNRFIPVAEECGQILAIGDWVMREACRQARVWQDDGLPQLVVSVNMSGLQLRRHGLVDQVSEILAQSGLAAEWLELELTESILVQDAENVLQTVRELKALGVKLAIDDFGTGYSSLSYLKRFAVDKLKIDQSFIRDICSDPEDAAIVHAVIQLGHSLNLKTIAEGAETPEQVQALRAKGCLEVQGYFYSKPLPPDEFAAYVRKLIAEGAIVP